METLRELERRLSRLSGQRAELEKQRALRRQRLAEIEHYLFLSDAVSEGLELLSDQMFADIATTLQESLTAALQEVLGQRVSLHVEKSFKRNSVNMDFYLERDGMPENIMKGTGGSVANILSVGLRFFAISTLDSNLHRRFLILDEQDCWLRPDLVPRLANVIRLAAQTLGFQVVVISHHDVSYFQPFADRIFLFHPGQEGVRVEQIRCSGSR